MAGTLKQSQVLISASWFWQSGTSPTFPIREGRTLALSLAAGTGASAASKVYVKRYSITASGTQDIVLSSLTDYEGAALAFTKIRGVVVINSTDNSGAASSIDFGPRNAVSNPISGLFQATTQAIKIQLGGAFGVSTPTAAGYTVSSGSADTVRIINNDGANAATVYVVFLGE